MMIKRVDLHQALELGGAIAIKVFEIDFGHQVDEDLFNSSHTDVNQYVFLILAKLYTGLVHESQLFQSFHISHCAYPLDRHTH